MISFSDARRLKAYNAATSTDIGTVSASVNGIDRSMNSLTLPGETAAHQIAEPPGDVLEQQQDVSAE